MKTKSDLTEREGRYHHGNLQKAMLDAALEIIDEQGTSNISLREIARRLGVSYGAPYRHFPSKDAMLARVATEGFQLYLPWLVQKVEAAGSDPKERLLASGEAYILFAVEHPAYFKVMFPPYGTISGEFSELEEAKTKAHQVLIDCIRACQEAGLVQEGDPMSLALSAWSVVHGLATLLIEKQLAPYSKVKDTAGIAKMVVRQFYHGLIKPV
jgi:AcrR family transcriptional regulator